eukprot:CAMPEP_0173247526 /NCGR_PEP_ID=MMETSP1142-20121109/17943_1 /TAXON_ID=483371 /ORGANISM="non described non described, Strain CCMP2298" /LENGTH=160 /DNA_ID=CAMNT_0014179913 /DNA_START=673 /DNA_END=1153 /DNA_ORIENTATION=+
MPSRKSPRRFFLCAPTTSRTSEARIAYMCGCTWGLPSQENEEPTTPTLLWSRSCRKDPSHSALRAPVMGPLLRSEVTKTALTLFSTPMPSCSTVRIGVSFSPAPLGQYTTAGWATPLVAAVWGAILAHRGEENLQVVVGHVDAVLEREDLAQMEDHKTAL